MLELCLSVSCSCYLLLVALSLEFVLVRQQIDDPKIIRQMTIGYIGLQQKCVGKLEKSHLVVIEVLPECFRPHLKPVCLFLCYISYRQLRAGLAGEMKCQDRSKH